MNLSDEEKDKIVKGYEDRVKVSFVFGVLFLLVPLVVWIIHWCGGMTAQLATIYTILALLAGIPITLASGYRLFVK